MERARARRSLGRSGRPRESAALRLPSATAGTLGCVNQRTAWIVYIVLRLLFFAVPFTVLYLIGWPWWLATVVAALIALALSIIFLQRQRDIASESVYEWRQRTRTPDDIVEDEEIDAGTSSPSDSAPAASTDTSHDDTSKDQH